VPRYKAQALSTTTYHKEFSQMKSLLGILTILISVSAQAAPSAQMISNVAKGLNGTYCMNFIETGIELATAVSNEQQENINYNLTKYGNLLKEAAWNVKNKRSNKGIYAQFKNALDQHRNETYSGLATRYQTVETGKAVVGCIERNVDLSAAIFNDTTQINNALTFIENLQKKAN
jgi:hypothetical protein